MVAPVRSRVQCCWERFLTKIEVLATAQWEVHYRGLNNPCGGSWGQVTKCRLNGQVFYVRENLAGKNFYLCSAARLGLKAETISKLPQVLELLAPADLWEELAQAVRQADQMDRPVRRNLRFTWAWAEKLFSQPSLPS